MFNRYPAVISPMQFDRLPVEGNGVCAEGV